MKKIMVIDTEGCADCPCMIWTHEHGALGCKAISKKFNDGLIAQINSTTANSKGVVPMWCPLKNIPESKTDWGDGTYSYEKGWNDVLKAIGVYDG